MLNLGTLVVDMASGGQDLKNWLLRQLGIYLLFLGFILAPIHSHTWTPPEYSSSEIIVPRRLATRSGKVKEGELSYAIRAAGKDYVIQLKPKTNLVSENFPVFMYDAEDRRVKIRPNISTKCYHEGYVEGVADSLAVLNTCFGLKGYLKIGGKSYEIEPLHDSPVLPHVLYLTEEVGPLPVGNRNGPAAKVRRGKFRGSNLIHPTYPKYVELYIVVDSTMLFYKAGEHQKVVRSVVDIVNIVDAHFHLLNTQLVLVGMEIWNRGNLINDSDDANTLIYNFFIWRKGMLANLTKHDTAHFFTYKNGSTFLGKSFGGAICKPYVSVGVQPYVNRNLVRFSKAFAHEMGHLVGLPDDEPECFCGPYRGCIMSSYLAPVSQFSNCSFQHFLDLSLEGALLCLGNIPPNVPVVTRCGNRVLDVGEQCDCGGPERCRVDPCCNTDCTFKAQAVCSSGPCCQDCKFLSSGHICRPQTNECDLPEYCRGDSEWCRLDVYVQDGTPCKSWTSFCYTKRCWSHAFLCSRIYGKRTDVAPEECFQKLNTAGNAIGNCGSSKVGKKYIKCRPMDVMCGRVHCAGSQKVHSDIKYIKVVPISVGESKCWATEYHGSIDEYDVGMVPDGIACGPKNICLGHMCQPTSLLTSRCDPEIKCSGRGVCNNRHNCHCNRGWAPPYCQHWGTGGSMDGGFPEMSYSTKLLRETFGTVIPVTVVVIATVTWLTPKLCAVMPGWSCMTEWWNKHRRQTVVPSRSVIQPRWE